VTAPVWAHAATMSETGSRHPLLVAGGVAVQVSKPLREHLLCTDCEQEIGKRESYLKRLAYDASDLLRVRRVRVRGRVGLAPVE
jgi:hypothetical protein